MNIEEYKKIQAKRKTRKYRNRKIVYNGVEFDSKKEYNRYIELKYMAINGSIKELNVHVIFSLDINKYHICNYIADFTYIVGNDLIVEDVKSEITRKLPVFALKKKLMKAILNIDIKEHI